MTLAQFDYPDGGVFYSILWIFLFVIWLWLLFTIFTDLFRDHETSGWVKAFWVIFVLILPFLGILIYLIARGSGMTERAMKAQEESQQQFDSYVRNVKSGSGESDRADQLAKFADLRDKGAISDDEFEKEKARILG